MAIGSVLAPAAISIGSSLIANAATDDPEAPDLTGPAREEIERSRRNLDEESQQARKQLEENLAARNSAAATSAGAREEMFDAQASARAELEGRAAEIISDAVRKEKLQQFRQDQRQSRNRAAGIASIGQNLANQVFMESQTEGGLFGGEPEGPGTPRFRPRDKVIEPDIDEFDTSLNLGGGIQQQFER